MPAAVIKFGIRYTPKKLSDDHFSRPEMETLIIQKILIFPDYQEFPDSTDGNGHWISIKQVKKPLYSISL